MLCLLQLLRVSFSSTTSMPRLFRLVPWHDWISPLIVVAKGLVSVGNAVPFPYINTALSSGLALLELIQMVGQSNEDLKYLAQSVVTIMQLLQDEIDCHLGAQDTQFLKLCIEFNTHIAQLSRDLESLSKTRSSSKFKKYMNSHRIRDEITEFTRRVSDLRANTTLVAAVGTRMDLVDVANGVAAVESKIADLQQNLNSLRSLTTTETQGTSLQTELVRFEQDYHALKLGDIHLEFHSARTAEFVDVDLYNGKKRHIGWTDYKATVKGCIRTVRVYQGSDPMESWKGVLSVLAETSPSPHLPQLFGFCSSPRMRSLVFHGEFCTLDEYGNTLSSSQAIVEWETDLLSDFTQLYDSYVPNSYGPDEVYWISGCRRFALANAHSGKLVISHVEPRSAESSYSLDPYPPFLSWFVSAGTWYCEYDEPRKLHASQRSFRDVLESLASLKRFSLTMVRGPDIHEVLTSMGRVYRRICDEPAFRLTPVAQLNGRDITPAPGWSAHHTVWHGRNFQRPFPWPPSACFPAVGAKTEPGWTHFVVPLMGKAQNWISYFDFMPHCGYFLNAAIEFGVSVPGIIHSWLAQSSSVLSKLEDGSDKTDPGELCIPTHTALQLTWEMVLTSETAATTILSELPEHLHVFVQVPTTDGVLVAEPRIRWSTDAVATETQSLPRGAMKIFASWSAEVSIVSWRKHHYDVVKSAQMERGFDPTTTDAAESLGLSLLEIPDLEISEALRREYDWALPFEMDPHNMEART
ncbi:hypothetical protein DFH09DRAFT_1359209, partial [Mycena vulgaris]